MKVYEIKRICTLDFTEATNFCCVNVPIKKIETHHKMKENICRFLVCQELESRVCKALNSKWDGHLASCLRCCHPYWRSQVQYLALLLAVVACFLFMQTLGGSGDGLKLDSCPPRGRLELSSVLSLAPVQGSC